MEFKNAIYLTLSSLTLGFFVKHLKNMYYEKHETFFINENRIILTENKEYSRQKIVEMGRESIRDKNTNKILINTIVDKDGYSYENINHEKHFENRILKQFIDQIKQEKKNIFSNNV